MYQALELLFLKILKVSLQSKWFYFGLGLGVIIFVLLSLKSVSNHLPVQSKNTTIMGRVIFYKIQTHKLTIELKTKKKQNI